MNSAADLKRYNSKNALDKAKQKIISALNDAPTGLQIAQIMTICQLSNKTVREVLTDISAYKEDEAWYLPKALKTKNAEPKMDTTEQIAKHQTLDDLTPKASVVKRETQEVAPESLSKTQKSYSEFSESELRQIPLQMSRCTAVIVQWECLGLKKMLDISGADRDYLFHHAQELVQRSMNAKVQEAAECFLKSVAAAEAFKVMAGTSKEEAKPIVEEQAIVKPLKSSEPENISSPKTEPLITKEDQPFSLENCKQMISTVVTRRSDLCLSFEQLIALLQQTFGLDEIEWNIRSNKILSVQLSKYEVVS
ncbi:hypothetical protein F939_02313 [Acinetobacter radioresistens DSM 6976 = NBRC 102413 = CIP 103788]|uniref:hypothetical protein n=1 Tax=Acinetobacter radioresistens TaxID=40216 RepID=UPI00028D40DB|nr:hypothetical protein [Acinetobacter radioresistens]ENV87529.1 hypothetical protein F939_02313 [Acinetobacter radioresistens DSM 6976 = NBRC 102413 = CIP 103788]BBL21160.1 hypothetical protein ACRAD_18310 [Acinetobacter radioresistens DSM 6976 = NBRC 102413 = CIP 103788]